MPTFQLQIEAPCHENWAGMTPEGQGRFCAACNKTVVDFSTMSDGQLIDYFRQPRGSVCGRFYQDQLQRDLVPVKAASKVPNLLFRYTWPAFVLALKSCHAPGAPERTMGKLAVRQADAQQPSAPPSDHYSFSDSISLRPDSLFARLRFEERLTFTTLGFVGTFVPPPEDASGPGGAKLMGEIAPVEIDTAACSPDALGVDETPEDTPLQAMDTVSIVTHPLKREPNSIAGGIAVLSSETLSPESKPNPPLPMAETIQVFPNPVRSGGLLTVSLPEEGGLPQRVMLYTIGGQQVLSLNGPAGGDATVFNLQLPAGIASGTYVLMLTHAAWKHPVSKKILIR